MIGKLNELMENASQGQSQMSAANVPLIKSMKDLQGWTGRKIE